MNFLSASTPLKLGFLTVLEEPSGYLGGYLVTNAWGRPLEFRLSTAVQPSPVQQILYGDTMRPYVCADLIGKTLVEKTATDIQIIVTDCQPLSAMVTSISQFRSTSWRMRRLVRLSSITRTRRPLS